MKTIAKILIAVILLMLSFQVTSAKDKGINSPGTGLIIYKVNIHLVPEPNYLFGDHFLVVITDENGSLVAPPQHFNINKLTYTFYEARTVNGTRVAALVPDPNIDPPFFPIIIPPEVKTGVFVPGSVYIFNLWPATTRTR